MFFRGKKEKQGIEEKVKRPTVDEASKENEKVFEELMKTLGYKKNGDGCKPEWIGEEGCFFDGFESIMEEDEQ